MAGDVQPAFAMLESETESMDCLELTAAAASRARPNYMRVRCPSGIRILALHLSPQLTLEATPVDLLLSVFVT